MASPAYVGGSLTTSAYNANDTSRVTNVPVGHLSGHLIKLRIALYTDGGTLSTLKTITWPSGFVQTQSVINTSVAGHEIQLSEAVKIDGGSEPANYTISWTGGVGCLASAIALSGVYATTPVDTSGTFASSGSVTASTGPSLTAGAADTLYWLSHHTWTDKQITYDTGWNDIQAASASPQEGYKAIAATGATGTFAQTWSGGEAAVIVATLFASQATAGGAGLPFFMQQELLVGGFQHLGGMS